MELEIVGKWAFIVGLAIAVIASFLEIPYIALILFVLGLVIGILNVTAQETERYLLGVVTLIILGVASIEVLSVLGVVSTYLSTIFANFIAFVGASALVPAVKAIVAIGKSK